MSTLLIEHPNGKVVKTYEEYNVFLDTFKVNGNTVRSLHDTGVTKAAIRRGLKIPNQYTGKTVRCTFSNGTSEQYPLAKVEMDGRLLQTSILYTYAHPY